MATAMISPKFYAWNPDTGKPLAFGTVHTYESGSSSTPKSTYQDELGLVENPNPVPLNAAGYASIYLSGTYNIVLRDIDGVTVWSQDPFTGVEQYTGEWILPSSLAYVSPTSFKIPGDVTSVFVRGRALKISGGTEIITHVDTTSYASGFTTVTIFGTTSLTSSITTVSVGLITSYPMALFDAQIAVTGGAIVGARCAAVYKVTGTTGGSANYLDGINGLTGGPVINGSPTALQTGDIGLVVSSGTATVYELAEDNSTPDGVSVILPTSGAGARRWKRKPSFFDLGLVYPVGIIISTFVNTNPAILFGVGTWALHGAGKVPICVDSTDADFDAADKTGGVKAITLSAAQSGTNAHTHTIGNQSSNHTHSGTTAGAGEHTHVFEGPTGQDGGSNGCASGSRGSITVNSSGSHVHTVTTGNQSIDHTHSITNSNAAPASEAHNNLQPYICEYRWRRTA